MANNSRGNTILYVLLALIMIDSLLEIAFISSMVSFLHIAHHDVPFPIRATQGYRSFQLYPKPAHPILNQGHTSNGAAGTAFFLAGMLGFIVLWLEGVDRKGKRNFLSRFFPFLRIAWPVLTVLSFFLTMGALIYTFIVTHATNASHQTISIRLAVSTSGKAYPAHDWTPENWFKQVLQLPFADPSQKNGLRHQLHLMEGWRFNLIPLFLLGLFVMAAAVQHTTTERRRGTLKGAGERMDVQEAKP